MVIKMIVTGIVVEYNPLHNGHLKHIEQARKITNCDVLIAVMSGNFVQRGEPAIIDKFQRTQMALDHGVDIVIEIPFPLVIQNASIFAESAVQLLNLAQCDYIVFGSELNDLEMLQTYADLNINVNNLREIMQDGTSYPKAHSLLSQSFFPNDILGVAYLKALKNTSITPMIIPRNNEGFPLAIQSASSIRKRIFNQEDARDFTPTTFDHTVHFMHDFFPLIKQNLLTANASSLKNIALFAEGIENNLIKQAANNYDYEHFIQHCVSRRYTRARINRTLLFMLTNIKQETLDELPALNELRVLGFNQVGRQVIKHLVLDEVKVVTKFKHWNKQYRELELKSTALYISTLDASEQEYLWNREFKGPIIID